MRHRAHLRHVWLPTSIVTLYLTFLPKVSYSIRTTNLRQSVTHLATNQTCHSAEQTFGVRGHLLCVWFILQHYTTVLGLTFYKIAGNLFRKDRV
jgi:hypothetical protein